MKRDIDLVRGILLAIEDNKNVNGRGWISLNIPGRSREEISYHVRLMYEAGLIDAVDLSTLDKYEWQPKELTWQGRDFLNTARDEGLWEQSKKEIERIGGFSFEVLKGILTTLATRNANT